LGRVDDLVAEGLDGLTLSRKQYATAGLEPDAVSRVQVGEAKATPPAAPSNRFSDGSELCYAALPRSVEHILLRGENSASHEVTS
jgi:hypothetical protein